ncbi:MAG: membrane-bound lytic murein transglycosylase MltF [Gallionella sp.]|nr:membrane-bound lytic murein transglycosylase MltF [Gallionella sp.]MDD4946294.1 membrane-bound lytic murein transglycosylase MltF [Gallionella sp.]MDD5612263.1 membrane-bound lytic murein transglycosylase MltF [Gallionella sp.]
MRKHKTLIRVLQAGILVSLLLFGYSNLTKPLPSWRNQELVIVIAQDSTLAYEEFSKQLARQFAAHLSVPLKIILTPANKVEETLRKRHAHLAASGFDISGKNPALLFGPGYLTVREQVVCNQYQRTPRNANELLDKHIAVVNGSNQEKALRTLLDQVPPLDWDSRKQRTVEDLLGEVAEGKLDCTVADHEQIEQMLNYHPNLAVAFDIGKPVRLGWAFPGNADNDLIAETEQFFTTIQKNGELNRLLDRYFGHNDRLDPLDATAFIANMESRLPRYRNLFEEAGKQINEDWRLIAAIAYQESHWDPLATSFTNVRGMMMLTEATADSLHVKNRLDARESTLGGARLLDILKKQLPSPIAEPTRTWMALAAYNQGQGHLEDARVLTQRNKGDPNSWVDVKKWMPLLNNPTHFSTLKHGYARGGEAVIFVENIRAYYDILTRLDNAANSNNKQHQYLLASTRDKPAFSLHLPEKHEPQIKNIRSTDAYSLFGRATSSAPSD